MSKFHAPKEGMFVITIEEFRRVYNAKPYDPEFMFEFEGSLEQYVLIKYDGPTFMLDDV